MITTNKFIGKMIFLFVGALAFTACSPEDGKDGVDGQQGQQGEQGPTGNANVTLYTFEGTYNFATTANLWFYCESATEDTENSLWQTFMISADEEILSYGVPGYGYNAASFYRAHQQIESNFFPGSTGISIRRYSGPGETYSKVRIFRILANNTGVTNRTMGKLYNGYTEEEVRAMSYEEFVNVFNISN